VTNVFHRHTKTKLRVAATGEGVYVVDQDGQRYLDASGGAAVSSLGHSDPDVRRAIVDQLDRLAYAHTAFFTTDVMEELAATLCDRAPGNLTNVYFVSGGSEGIETALKMARQYFLEVGQPERRHFIARRQSYHGNTLGALSVGGNLWRREPFDPILMPATHIAPCYPYRDRHPDESEAAYGERVADELETSIQELGPETVAAFVAETVVGATAGALTPVPGYFQRVREVCDRHGVLLILDEVMCGMGRTGSLLAYEQEGIAPDIVVVAKGLGAGYQPIGGVLVSAPIYEAFVEGTGYLQHGFTYMGHATACAAALAVVKAIEGRDLLTNVRGMGDKLDAALTDRFGNHPNVGDIRGRGLFRALEFVSDRTNKKPFDPKHALNAKIKKAAMARGLMCYPMGGTIDGRRGDHVLLAPPFIIDESHVAEITDKLAGAVDDALQEVRG
jgi:adenosylmethionine-8-amino-7-oxononanoate aminotransferase